MEQDNEDRKHYKVETKNNNMHFVDGTPPGFDKQNLHTEIKEVKNGASLKELNEEKGILDKASEMYEKVAGKSND